jgi:hypothetical protein
VQACKITLMAILHVILTQHTRQFNVLIYVSGMQIGVLKCLHILIVEREILIEINHSPFCNKRTRYLLNNKLVCFLRV